MSVNIEKLQSNLMQGYMVKKYYSEVMGLRSAELMVYAIIASFSGSADGDGVFSGSVEYLSNMTGFSVSTVRRVIRKLLEKGYIIRDEYAYIYGSHIVIYRADMTLAANMLEEYSRAMARLKRKEEAPIRAVGTGANC